MSASFEFAVVSASDATKSPYPIVWVNSDGSVRELHEKEREYLETLFSPFDGGRPYVKNAYADENALGDPRGYCSRSVIPSHLIVLPAPAEDPG